jgi:hypothetical protein
MARQSIGQLKRPRAKNGFVAIGPREEFQMDLMDMSRYGPAPRRYALVAVDVFSKAIAAVPIRNKTSEECAGALEVVFSRLDLPTIVLTDPGGEFRGAFEARLRRYDVEHIAMRTYARFVERAILTLKRAIFLRRQAFPGRSWVSLLDEVVSKYNTTPRESTGMTPMRAAKESNRDTVYDRLMRRARFPRRDPPLQRGDLVKVVRKPSGPDDRADFVAWSHQAHAVEGPEILNGIKLFRIEGARKLFLRHELLKVEDAQAPVPHRRGSVEEAPWRLRSVLRVHGRERDARTPTRLRRAKAPEEIPTTEVPAHARRLRPLRRLRRLPDDDDG